MRKLIIVLTIITFIFNGTAAAQNQNKDKGPFALQFKILNLLDFSSFKGAAFSGKYTLGELNALRLGIDVFWDNDTADSTETYIDEFGIDKYEETESKSLLEIDLFLDYLRYIIDDIINLYIGIGVFGGIIFSESEYEDKDPGETTSGESSGRGWLVGLSPFIGCEWWFHFNLSLSLEYQLRLRYSKSQYESEGKSDISKIEFEESTSEWLLYPYQIDCLYLMFNSLEAQKYI